MRQSLLMIFDVVRFAILSGGDAGAFAKATGEVEGIVETDALRDLADGETGLNEETAGLADAQALEVLGGGGFGKSCPIATE
jgi:hypothetical protein